LQGKCFKVALVTDGRMSGASGKVPAAIHLSPEALGGGPLAKLRDGDLVRLDGVSGRLEALVPQAEWAARTCAQMPAELTQSNGVGMGRELFASARRNALSAEEGACTWL
jgi:phosphogluconate dehydratase